MFIAVFVPNAAKQMAPKGTTVIPVPEGRMRLLEQQQYSSSLEANISRLEPRVHRPSPLASPIPPRKNPNDPQTLNISPKISAAISNGASKNPFEDETYDDTKNPFAEDEVNDPSNPFGEDDYDKNLNPFS